MRPYYQELPNLKVNYRRGHGGNGLTEKIFEHSEWTNSGDFCLIYQDIFKTVIPLVEIDTIEYPYEMQ